MITKITDIVERSEAALGGLGPWNNWAGSGCETGVITRDLSFPTGVIET